MYLEIAILSGILMLCAYLFLGLLRNTVISNNKKRYLFASTILGVVLWVISIILTELFAENLKLSLLMSRFSMVFSIIIATFFSLFVTEYEGEKKKHLLLTKVFLFISVILIFLSLSNLVVESVDMQGEKLVSTLGPLHGFFSVFIFCYFMFSIYRFVVSYKNEQNALIKAQKLFILLGSVISIVLSIVTNLFVPALGLGEIRALGPFSLLFFLGFTYYAVIRYRFLSVRLLIGRFVYIVIIALYPFISFHVIYYLVNLLWGSVYSGGSLIFGFIISILFVYFLLIADTKLRTFVNKKIVNEGYSPQEVLSKLVSSLSNRLELSEVSTAIIDALNSSFSAGKIGIITTDVKHSGIIYSLCSNGDDLYIDEGVVKKLVEYSSPGQVFIKEELLYKQGEGKLSGEEKKIFEVVSRAGIDVGICFSFEDKLSGLLYLVETERVFSTEDIRFLKSLKNAVLPAIGRGALYREVKLFAEKLQKEVDEATKKLRVQNEKLKQIDKMKDDLISIAGHELRTPATVAKGNMYLLKKHINKKKVRDKYLDRAIDALEREAELVTILLEASRIGKDTLELMVDEIDFEEVSRHTVEDHKQSAKKKGLKLVYKKPKKKLPKVYADKTRIREVMDNLITNAIKYTIQGKVTVWLELKDKKVWFHIKDTGIGIPKNEIPNLFNKFYRVKNYTSGSKKLLRPGGTGLGLYVSKNIVKRHGGDVTVVSKEGKGSTFSFYIPLSFKGNLGTVKDLPKASEREADMFKVMALKKNSRN